MSKTNTASGSIRMGDLLERFIENAESVGVDLSAPDDEYDEEAGAAVLLDTLKQMAGNRAQRRQKQ